MVGITSYGAYIPLHRLSRAEISRAWGGTFLTGEKAVANYDEDSVTMAVAACLDCVKDINLQTIDSLYFASTTFPYKEKQSASIVATALDLGQDTFTLDLSNSLRSGTSGVKIAMDTVNQGSAKNILVCAADVRLGRPNGIREIDFGDGTAALLIGNTGVIATIDGIYNINKEIIDVWRSAEDTFVHSWEERFAREKGYAQVVREAVSGIFQKYNVTAKDFSKAVFYAPNPGALTMVARSLGFDTKIQVQNPLYDTVGNTGCAFPLMMLVAALEEARPGDKLLWVGYGDGCDVYILTVTEEIDKMRDKRGIRKHLASKKSLPSYEKYLQWREIITTEPPARPPLEVPSAVALWRDSRRGLALYGVKCRECGTPQYPAQRVCMVCRAKDKFDDYRFADKEGKVTTFCQDNLAASVDPPSTVTVVDFMGGGRIMCDMTDRDPKEVKIGMRVEMTFRKVRHAGGIHDYWWKCQPLRC